MCPCNSHWICRDLSLSISVVTGGSGFIGQHLVAQLRARGEMVRIVDLVAPPSIQAGVTFIRGSVTDPALVRRAMEDARIVYHSAAVPHLWSPDPAIYQEVNVDGSRVVFEAALGAGIEKVVHTSSSTVLMDRNASHHPALIDESYQTAEGDLAGHYAKSKWRAEALARAFADRLPIVTVMPTLPFGPGDRHVTPPTRMLRDFINGEMPAYIDCLLNIVDVRDVAAGHILACEQGKPGTRYLLNQHTIGMKTFLQHLQALTGRTMPQWRIPPALALAASAVDEAWSTHVTKQTPRASFAGTCMAVKPVGFSNNLARSVLGLPETPLLQTLIDAVGWLAEGGYVTSPRRKFPLAFSGR